MAAPDAGNRDCLHHEDVEAGAAPPDLVISEDHDADATHSEDSEEDSQGSRHHAVLHAPPLPSTLPIQMSRPQVGQTGQQSPQANLPGYIRALEDRMEARFAEEGFHGPLIHHSHHHHYFTRKHRYHFSDNSRHYHLNHVHHHHYHHHHNHYYYPIGGYNGFNGNGNWQILQTQPHRQFHPVGVPVANTDLDLDQVQQGEFCFPFI